MSKSYKDVEALKSLDLRVAKNSILGFLEPNGAGKTTTIKLLLGLTRPTSGVGCAAAMIAAALTGKKEATCGTWAVSGRPRAFR